MRFLLTSFVFIAVSIFSGHPAIAWEVPAGPPDEYDTTPYRPYDITLRSDGAPWLTYRDESLEPPLWPRGIVFTVDPGGPTVTAYQAPPGWGDCGFQTLDTGPDDTLWIADQYDRLVNFDPDTSVFTPYALPGGTFNLPASPFGVTAGPDGAIWITCNDDRSLGRYDPGADTWERFPGNLAEELPGPPVEIAFDGSGNAWFTMKTYAASTPGLGRLNTGTGEITTWLNPYGALAPSNPFGIAVAGGTVWFLDHTGRVPGDTNTGLLVRFHIGTEAFTPYDVPDQLTDPHFLAVDPGGVIWFTAFASSRIGTFDPVTEAFSYGVALANPAPMGIDLLPATRTVWWAETDQSGQGGAGRYTIPEPTGACCYGTVCEPGTTAAGCQRSGGRYLGDGTDCDPNPCLPPAPQMVPTLGEWGMLVFVTLAGTLAVLALRRRAAAPSGGGPSARR